METGNSDSEGAWTEEKNALRCRLIDKEIDESLTPEEKEELERLTEEMEAYLDRVAPAPDFEKTRRIIEERRRLAGERLDQ